MIIGQALNITIIGLHLSTNTCIRVLCSCVLYTLNKQQSTRMPLSLAHLRFDLSYFGTAIMRFNENKFLNSSISSSHKLLMMTYY